MQKGDWLVLAGARSAMGRAMASGWRANGGRVLALSRHPKTLPGAFDALMEADFRHARAAAERLGEWSSAGHPVAGFVFAAGLVYADRATATTGDEWQQTLAVNLEAPFLLARTLKPHFTKPASVVMVSSLDARRAPRLGPDAAYGAAKAGLESLVRHLAAEWGPDQVRVNAVAPGPMAGGMGVADDSVEETLHQQAVDGRLVTPEEVADLTLFLLSDHSQALTGQVLAADHGFGLLY